MGLPGVERPGRGGASGDDSRKKAASSFGVWGTLGSTTFVEVLGGAADEDCAEGHQESFGRGAIGARGDGRTLTRVHGVDGGRKRSIRRILAVA